MNADEIRNMPAGREMDELIARRVMGIKPPPSSDVWLVLPYSTDIAAAWEVVEKMGDKFDDLERGTGGFYMVTVYPGNPNMPIVVRGETAPLAICRAALLAMGEHG